MLCSCVHLLVAPYYPIPEYRKLRDLPIGRCFGICYNVSFGVIDLCERTVFIGVVWFPHTGYGESPLLLPRKPGPLDCFPASRKAFMQRKPLPGPTPSRVSDELGFRSCWFCEDGLVAVNLEILTKSPWELPHPGSATLVSLVSSVSPGPWSDPKGAPPCWEKVVWVAKGKVFFCSEVFWGLPWFAHITPQITDVPKALQVPCLLPCRAFPRPQTLTQPPQSPASEPPEWDFQRWYHLPTLAQLEV